MSNEIVTTNKPNYLMPQTFEQAERYAEKIAVSSLCPSAFKNKPGDVLIALQMGAEVGLSPMQAIQNIAVINGRPSLWGDAAIGVVRVHPHCQSIREWMEGDIASGNAIAYCAVTRKGQPEEIRQFSIQDAEKASLWKKAGPWTQYPARMLQMRARGFAIRDTFPDALRGLHVAEEAQDMIDITPTPAYIPAKLKTQQIEGTPLSQTFEIDPEVLALHILAINSCSNWEELKKVYIDAKKATSGDKEASNKISKLTKERQDYIKQLEKPVPNPEELEVKRGEFWDEHDTGEKK